MLFAALWGKPMKWEPWVTSIPRASGVTAHTHGFAVTT